MANFLNKLLKPIRLDVDPSSQTAPKQFKHWLQVFSDFVAGCLRQAAGQDGQPQVDKLRILFFTSVLTCMSSWKVVKPTKLL